MARLAPASLSVRRYKKSAHAVSLNKTLSYASNPDHYIDFETGVLKNLLGITTVEKLEEAEADITAAIIATAPEEPPLGAFDLEHLQNIHWELFNAIYDWAGEIRDVEVAACLL